MIIIRKKRIITLISIIFVTLFIANIKIDKQEETVETVAIPVTNKVIVVDAGHGVPDEGAQSSTRNNRGRDQFKNSFEITKFTRTIWSNSNINS